MKSDLELFVITSERETLNYVMDSIEKQSVHRKVTVIRNLPWIEALKECMKQSQSAFYMRIDDDMVLHKHVVAYYSSKIKQSLKYKHGIYVCKLWEDWSKKAAGGLRMYSTKVARKIDFRPNKLGKVDKPFRADMQKIGFSERKDSSIVGLHMINSEETQERLRELWRKQASSNKMFSASFDNLIHPYYLPIEQQYKKLKKIESMNKKRRSSYFNFMENKQ